MGFQLVQKLEALKSGVFRKYLKVEELGLILKQIQLKLQGDQPVKLTIKKSLAE